MIIDSIHIDGKAVNFINNSSTIWVDGRLITHPTELKHWVTEIYRYFAYKELQRQVYKKPYTGTNRNYKRKETKTDFFTQVVVTFDGEQIGIGKFV